MKETLRNVIGCWYEAGDAGTWLTWFINQHKNFVVLPCALQYGQQDHDMGNIPTDYACTLSNWVVAGNKTTSWHDFLVNIETRLFEKRNNSIEKQGKLFYRNFCYKLIPFHNPISTGLNELKELDIENKNKFLQRIIAESNTSTILYPTVTTELEIFAKRLAFIRPQYTVNETRNFYAERKNIIYNRNKNYMKTICNNVVTVEIDKLVIHQDLDTYKKLCNELKILPNKNWKAIAKSYYETIYLPLENIDSNRLDSRTNVKI
jgi:hypothetical protein